MKRVASARAAAAWLAERGAIPFAEMAAAIAGEPIRGSWWAHPAGKKIFRIVEALGDSEDVLAVKAAEGGRVALVHRALWPALLRVLLDADWRRGAMRGLPASAVALLKRVEKVGVVRAPAAADKKAKEALERRLLVLALSEHTAKGRHETLLRSWRAWADEVGLQRVAAMSFDEARDRIGRAGLVCYEGDR